MTSFKQLLDEAAGDDPGITDADLAADLRRGQQSLRRRRFAGVASAAVATAVVAGGVWTAVPGAGRPGTAPDPAATGSAAASASPTPKPTKTTKRTTAKPTATSGPGRQITPRKTPPPGYRPPLQPPRPAQPVALVPDGKLRKGTNLVCDLKPKGWTVTAFIDPTSENFSTLTYTDPQLKNPGQYTVSTTMRVLPARIYRGANGRMEVDKYGVPWEDLPHVRAGDKEAVVTGPDGTASKGVGEVHVRVGTTKLVQVSNDATGLGWDQPTLLRFAGSCRRTD